MNEYLSLLMEGKTEEAEKVRKQSIPHKLVKFISLGDKVDENEKRFKALEDEEIWFSSADTLNDPYEYQGMYINEKRLKDAGYPQKIIDCFKSLIGDETRKWALVSLSENTFDSLPMWAYYTNNYAGYCVEYEVLYPDAIHRVSYEPERIPLASIPANFFSEFQKMQEQGEKTNSEVEFYANLMQQQFFLKHESWKHEKEYRMIFPLGTSTKGLLVPISCVGLKTSRIVAGIKCKPEHIERLRKIAVKLSCGNVAQIAISATKYTLVEEI